MTEEKLKQYMEGNGRTQGGSNPFKVPEGYFDTLCDRVMAQLPEQQKPIRRTLIPRLWRYAAVLVVGVVGSACLLIPHLKGGQDNQLAQTDVVEDSEVGYYYDDDYFSDALDYAMVDNNEIAMYLTEN